MIQLDSCGYKNADSESNSAPDEDLKENSCDDKENSIDNDRKQKQKQNNLKDSSSIAMAESEASRVTEEVEDVNGNLEDNGKSIAKDEPDDEQSAGDENEMEPGEISFSQAQAMDLQANLQAQSAASAVLSEASAIFNNAAMFQPGQMSMQTFQNAIAQFTANAIANNTDNETVMKSLAILQSALFTFQQQQFLQFQLIQHLQSQLVNKKSDGEKLNSKCDSDDEDLDSKMKDDIDEEDGEMEELEDEQQNQIHKRLMENKHFSKMQEALLKENENRISKSKSHENGDSENILKKAEEGLNGLNAFTSNFSLSNIITDHDPSIQISESTNSLAMLEKKAQEVLNSASQGILSNNLLDELAFANDKASPNGRSDSSLFKHRCRYCGKIFGSDSSLQIHIRSHTGERPYKCNVCGSRFTTKGNLKVHFQRHSDKYPHIPMNPNPVPEHLDKYFPPLVPSEALKEMPNAPPSSNQPFPNIENRQFPQRGFFPDFYLPRPPIELFGPIGAGEAARNPVDLSQIKKPESPGFRLSPEVMIHEEEEEEDEQPPKQTIKEEPEDETLDLSDKNSHKNSLSENNIQTVKPPAITQPLHISSPNINNNNHHHHHHHHNREKDESNDRPSRSNRHEREREKERERDEKEFSLRMKNNSIENLAKVPSVSPPSSSSSTSGSLYQDTVLDPSYFSAHLPRPDSNDSSWENFIEISSETSKLQELVDNIDNKNIEPNQCLVCKKVLSCRSALQMHYRVHTGERPFRCKICGRSFTTKGNLKTHMSVHRIKPPMRTLHQCPVCHQKFSNIFVLQQHIRLHTGEMTDLTPDQIRAAEIREFPEIRDHNDMKMPPYSIRMPDFQAQKRPAEHSDDENDVEMTDENREREPVKRSSRENREVREPREKSHSNRSHRKNNHSNSDNHREGIRVKTGLTSPDIENHVEDLRAMNLQRLSVHSASNDDYSRDSSPVSPSISEAKRLRSSSPPVNRTPPSLSNRSPIATPPSNDRPPFPYGPHFLGMPQFPPFINRPPFMANVPIVPSSANMPPFGLFGVRGNTTTCNICFKTFACNSALEIHYRSHTKERPFKCSICDRGFSTKGNMKQHQLTHKIRDMFGNSNSGDESRMSAASGGGHTSDSQSTINNSNQQINFAIKLEKSRSPNFIGDKHGQQDDELIEKEKETAADFSKQKFPKDPDLKKWRNKLNEMPENIAAS